MLKDSSSSQETLYVIPVSVSGISVAEIECLYRKILRDNVQGISKLSLSISQSSESLHDWPFC